MRIKFSLILIFAVLFAIGYPYAAQAIGGSWITSFDTTHNPSIYTDKYEDIAVYGSTVYVGGREVTNTDSSDTVWKIKQESTAGASLNNFFSFLFWNPPGTKYESIYALAVDASGVYAVGTDGIPGNQQWRMEKYDHSGNVLWEQTYNHTAQDDMATGIVVQGNYVYISGYAYNSTYSDYGAFIHKRRADNGSLCTATMCTTEFGTGGIVSQYGLGNVGFMPLRINIVVNSSNVFISGTLKYSSPATLKGFIQKMNLNTGAIDGLFGNVVSPLKGTIYGLSYTYNTVFNSIALLAGVVYSVGYNDSSGNNAWLVTRFRQDSGVLDQHESRDYSDGDDSINKIIVSNDGKYSVYVVGYDSRYGGMNNGGNTGDLEWRIEEINLGGPGIIWEQVYNPTINKDMATSLAHHRDGVNSSYLYIVGYGNDTGVNGGDSDIRVRKLDTGIRTLTIDKTGAGSVDAQCSSYPCYKYDNHLYHNQAWYGSVDYNGTIISGDIIDGSVETYTALTGQPSGSYYTLDTKIIIAFPQSINMRKLELDHGISSLANVAIYVSPMTSPPWVWQYVGTYSGDGTVQNISINNIETISAIQLHYTAGTTQYSSNGMGRIYELRVFQESAAVRTLTPTPDLGYAFAGWTGCDSVSGDQCTVRMNTSKAVTANFIPKYTLTVSKTLNGTVSVAGGTVTYSDPVGFSCPVDTCSSNAPPGYVSGTQVALSATPATGYIFSGWSGGGCSGTGSCTVTMTGDTIVTANFITTPKYTLTVSKTLNGTVSVAGGTVTYSDPVGFSCPVDTCSSNAPPPYVSGTQVTLTASTTTGYSFSGWSGGGCSGTAASCLVTLDANKTVTASFNLAYIDCGLKAYDGAQTVTFACEPIGTVTSPLRISKGGTTYGIVLVDPADSSASKFKVQTGAGTKALRKL